MCVCGIWHTYKLDEYLEVFFSFFQNLYFWALGTLLGQNYPKTLGQPREVKNGPIMLKIGTLEDWINTWGFFFIFSSPSRGKLVVGWKSYILLSMLLLAFVHSSLFSLWNRRFPNNVFNINFGQSKPMVFSQLVTTCQLLFY